MVVVTAPLAGIAMPLHDVPDPVFAQSLVGPGMAITPPARAQTVVSPVPGRLVKLKTHGFVVATDGGHGVLVHLGLDTVRLDCAASEPIAAEGQLLRAGDAVALWHPERVLAAGLNPVCPVIALEALAGAIEALAGGPVEVGAPLFRWS